MKNKSTSDHHNGEHFFNPHVAQEGVKLPRGLLSVIKMYRQTERAKWPTNVKNFPNLRLHEKLKDNEIAVTFVNHATVLIQLPGFNILTDPVWSERASPFAWVGPKRARKPGIAFMDLPKIDLVLVSHNHYDHMDVMALRMLQHKFAPKFFVALGDKTLARSIGLKDVEEFDWWQNSKVNASIDVTFVPTQHFSARGLFDRNHSLWGSYMIRHNNHLIYFGGDSGYSKHYQEIFEKFGAVDLAFLPIGAYEPRWFMKTVHMNPAEAVQAHQDIKSKQSVGIHYGTFQLTAEAIDQPVIDLKVALKESGIGEDKFVALGEGQTKIYTL